MLEQLGCLLDLTHLAYRLDRLSQRDPDEVKHRPLCCVIALILALPVCYGLVWLVMWLAKVTA